MAGIACRRDDGTIDKRDERGRSIDVHALRHTFGTHLSKGGVSLRTAQAAMRHSDPKLTACVYTDPKLLDVAGALDALPDLPLDADKAEQQRATGTDDALSLLAPMLAPNSGKPCTTGAIVDKADNFGVTHDDRGRVDVSAYSVKSSSPLSSADTGLQNSGRLDSNQRPLDPQLEPGSPTITVTS